MAGELLKITKDDAGLDHEIRKLKDLVKARDQTDVAGGNLASKNHYARHLYKRAKKLQSNRRP
jgi:hypothetical protein